MGFCFNVFAITALTSLPMRHDYCDWAAFWNSTFFVFPVECDMLRCSMSLLIENLSVNKRLACACIATLCQTVLHRTGVFEWEKRTFFLQLSYHTKRSLTVSCQKQLKLRNILSSLGRGGDVKSLQTMGYFSLGLQVLSEDCVRYVPSVVK